MLHLCEVLLAHVKAHFVWMRWKVEVRFGMDESTSAVSRKMVLRLVAKGMQLSQCLFVSFPEDISAESGFWPVRAHKFQIEI